jgi:hypothetical protein
MNSVNFLHRTINELNMKRKKIFLYIKRVRIVSFFCRKLFSDSSSLRGAQRRSNPEGRGFLDCFIATLLTMTLFASDMLRDLRLTPKVLNMKLQFGVANNPEQAAGAARGTVSPSSELRSSSTPSELSRWRCYPRTALRLFGVIGYAELKFHIEVLQTSNKRHHAFSCGMKRIFIYSDAFCNAFPKSAVMLFCCDTKRLIASPIRPNFDFL